MGEKLLRDRWRLRYQENFQELFKAVYDLEAGRFLRLIEAWGHPSWTPDDKAIFEYGNYSTDVVTGKTFDNGVLTLQIPKADDVKPKQIQIKAGASEPVTVTPTSGNGSESK